MKNIAAVILLSAVSMLFVSVAHAEHIGGGAPLAATAPPEHIGGGVSATEEPPEHIGGGDAFWVVIEWFFLR